MPAMTRQRRLPESPSSASAWYWDARQTRGLDVHLPTGTPQRRLMESSLADGRDSVETIHVAGDRDGASKGHTEGGDVVTGLAHEGQS
jgi:hypothetical protein